MKKPITAMAALLFTSALTATAIAQQPGTTGAPQQGAPQTQNMPQQQNLPDASDFSDSDLDAFVATQKDMAGIQKSIPRSCKPTRTSPRKPWRFSRKPSRKWWKPCKTTAWNWKNTTRSSVWRSMMRTSAPAFRQNCNRRPEDKKRRLMPAFFLHKPSEVHGYAQPVTPAIFHIAILIQQNCLVGEVINASVQFRLW